MVKILHLSDLHFCGDSQSDNMKNILLSEAREVRNLQKGEKMLVITGDFHNFNSSDYTFAKEFIDRLIAEMDIDCDEDVFIVPGNHDVGNETALGKTGVDPMRPKAAIFMVKMGEKEYLEWRLEAFVPYCEFSRDIGVYSDSDKLLPAKVHVRRWRNKLNILHLNTALIAGKGAKDNQMVDVDAAVTDETWDLYHNNLPALALGHNSFFDLDAGQQNALKTMFVHRNISAYLCGDTHRVNVNPDTQNIILESGGDTHPLIIKNVICAKGISDSGDNYSDFGYYWHIWDEKTDKVDYSYRRFTPDTLAKTVPDGRGDGSYYMRRKSNTPTADDPIKPNADDLRQFLDDLLLRTQENHPSFVLLNKDDIDERLFSQAAELKRFVPWGRTEKNGPISPVWEIIRESWTDSEKRNIVIEGVGGIGKTVALFSVLNIKDRSIPPAVYVPMYRLVDESGDCINLSNYLESLSILHGHEISNLAAASRGSVPKLLVMLDGFNEVPGNRRRKMLHMVNDWLMSNHGAQLIVVSRPMDGMNLKNELKGKNIGITLEPLSVDIVQEYLGDRTPPKSSPIWEVLTRPLFLNLYIKTDCLEDQKNDGYVLAPKKAESGGAIIWNYLQRELQKIDQEDWVIRCALACEYIIPYLAYTIEKEHRFTIERNKAMELVNEVILGLDPNRLPHHLLILMREYKRRHFSYPDISVIDWNNTVFNDIGLMKYNEDSDEDAFIHQNFRDALAGLHLVNQAEMMRNGDTLPDVWRRAANHYVMDYAAELIEELDAERLWEANRNACPTDSSSTYAMMELQRRRFDGADSKLNFSGMDLRGISLTRYMKEGNKNESDKKDMKLFRTARLSHGVKLDKNTFRSPGHIGPINCIAVTENGLCVSGSWDRTLRVWDIRTGECLHTMEGHTDSVYCSSVSVDCLCVSVSGDNTLRVWDIRTGDCLRSITGCTDLFRCSNMTEDNLCATGSRDKNLRVWDLSRGELIYTMTGHTDWVTCVVVTKEGLCISGSDDNTIRVWDIITGKPLHIMSEHTACVNCVAVTKEGLCVSGSDDKTVRVWDIRSGKCLRVMTGHTDWVRCVVTTDDGRCVSGSYDGTLRVWDIRTGQCLQQMTGHTGVICGVAVTEGGLCVSGSWDNTIRVWDLHTGECIRIINGQYGRVKFAVKTTDGLRINGIGDRSIRVIDIHTGECLRVMNGHTSWINRIILTNDGLCVSGSDDKTIRVWNYYTGKCLRTLRGHFDSVKCVAETKDGKCISGSSDNTLKVWDIHSGECLRTMSGHALQINSVAVTEDGKCVSGSDDKTVRVWDISSGKCLQILEGHTDSVSRVTVTENGVCVSESDDETVRKWNINTGECVDVLYPMEIETEGMNFAEAELTPKLAKALWQNNATIPQKDLEQYVRNDATLTKKKR